MTEETGNRTPMCGPEPLGDARWPEEDPAARVPPEGPPPVYVRPALPTPDPAPRRRAARDEERPFEEEVTTVSPRVGGFSRITQVGSRSGRTARNHLRRNRKRGLLRLSLVVAIVVAAIILAVTLAARGGAVEEQADPILYAEEIAQVAQRYDLDPYLVAAVAKTESGYRAAVVSPAGAVGLMQLMPGTADWVTGLDIWQGDSDPVLTDPADSLELGACYLRYLMDRFDDRTQIALAAYNAGQGTVDGWLATAGGVESFDLADIVYPETQEFVRRVEHHRDLYTRVHPDAFLGSGGST